MRKPIDPKYSIEVTSAAGDAAFGGDILRIVKTTTGVPIPDDEPLILFRARDQYALDTLEYYLNVCRLCGCTDFHLRGIQNRINEFKAFREQHPERMKEPGVTKGL